LIPATREPVFIVGFVSRRTHKARLARVMPGNQIAHEKWLICPIRAASSEIAGENMAYSLRQAPNRAILAEITSDFTGYFEEPARY